MPNDQRLTDADIEAIERRHAESTAGIWKAKDYRICANVNRSTGFQYICDTANNKASRTIQNAANAEFMAEAHQDVPRLIAELRAVRDENGQMRAALLRLADQHETDMHAEYDGQTKLKLIAAFKSATSRQAEPGNTRLLMFSREFSLQLIEVIEQLEADRLRLRDENAQLRAFAGAELYQSDYQTAGAMRKRIEELEAEVARLGGGSAKD